MEARARGVEFDTKNPIKKLQLTMPLIIPLTVSSVKKADASALAAEQRRFLFGTLHLHLNVSFGSIRLC